MREILFRGKRIDTGEWIVGDLINNYDGRKFIGEVIIDDYEGTSDDQYDIGIGFAEVDPSTIGQYTGLTDKNGKKIFEGDIVSGFFNHKKIVGYIFYGSDASFFIQRDGLFGIGLNNASDWLEVIGNIHDNPELLEDK